MKQDNLSADYQNLAIEHCRALTDDDANADPGKQQGAAVALLTILEADDTELSHYESGERFKVTFHKGTDAHKAEGAVILQGIDKPPVGVLVQHVGTDAAPTTNIARMGDEGELADDEIVGDGPDIQPDGFNAAAELDDDGNLADPEAYEAPADDGTVAEDDGEAGA